MTLTEFIPDPVGKTFMGNQIYPYVIRLGTGVCSVCKNNAQTSHQLYLYIGVPNNRGGVEVSKEQVYCNKCEMILLGKLFRQYVRRLKGRDSRTGPTGPISRVEPEAQEKP